MGRESFGSKPVGMAGEATAQSLNIGTAPMFNENGLSSNGKKITKKSSASGVVNGNGGTIRNSSSSGNEQIDPLDAHSFLNDSELLLSNASVGSFNLKTGGNSSSSSGNNKKKKEKVYVSPNGTLGSSANVNIADSAGLLISPPADASNGNNNRNLLTAPSASTTNSTGGLVSGSTASSISLGNIPASRRLVKQHSALENYDLSHHYEPRTTADDNNAAAAAAKSGEKRTSTQEKPAAAVVVVVKDEEPVTVCNCKKSKCLKLYCDCFAVMNYCSGTCNCYDCCNRVERESIRMEAIKSTKERNQNAFKTKINEKEQHNQGCHCKNSQCLKKYCECYTNAAFCGVNCKCLTCLNYSGSVELAKARNNMRDGDGSAVGKKRKESPTSVAFQDSNTPVSASTSVVKGASEMASPDLKPSVIAGSVGSVVGTRVVGTASVSTVSKSSIVGVSKITSAGAPYTVLASGSGVVPASVVGSTGTGAGSSAISGVGSTAMNGGVYRSSNAPTVRAVSLVPASSAKPVTISSSSSGAKQVEYVAATPIHNVSLGMGPPSTGSSTLTDDMLSVLASGGSTSSCADMNASAKRLKLVASTPASAVSDQRQLRSRKGTDGSSEQTLRSSNSSGSSTLKQSAGAAQSTVATSYSSSSSSSSSAPIASSASAVAAAVAAAKKRQVKFAPIVYPFFGTHRPHVPKAIALRCLDYLDQKDIYSMSIVNSLWCSAATDEALWE
jgi:hypothetical protein